MIQSDDRIVLFGNSHTLAVKSAAPTDIRVIRNSKMKGIPPEDAVSVEAFTASCCVLPSTALIAIAHLGTMHNIIGLLEHEQPFRLLDGSAHDVSEHILIPESVMASWFSYIFRKGSGLFTDLQQVTKARIVHIMAPPPKDDFTLVDSKNFDQVQRNIAGSVISPSAHRLALWRCEKRQLDAYLAEINVIALPPPPETLDDAGFLLPEYSARDVTHANAAYGALVAEQLRQLAS